jgi:hypothetical protein
MGYYPLFASVAEAGILTNPQMNADAMTQVLRMPLVEVMTVVEYKKALNS